MGGVWITTQGVRNCCLQNVGEFCACLIYLTYCGLVWPFCIAKLVQQFCITKLVQHKLRSCLVAYLAPSLNLNQWGLSVRPLGTNLSEIWFTHFTRETFWFTKINLLIHKNKSKDVLYKMSVEFCAVLILLMLFLMKSMVSSVVIQQDII